MICTLVAIVAYFCRETVNIVEIKFMQSLYCLYNFHDVSVPIDILKPQLFVQKQ